MIGAQNGHFMEFTVLGPLPWEFTAVNTRVYGRKLMFVHFFCALVVIGYVGKVLVTYMSIGRC